MENSGSSKSSTTGSFFVEVVPMSMILLALALCVGGALSSWCSHCCTYPKRRTTACHNSCPPASSPRVCTLGGQRESPVIDIGITPKGSLRLTVAAPGRALCGREVMRSPHGIPLDDWRDALCIYCAVDGRIDRGQKTTGPRDRCEQLRDPRAATLAHMSQLIQHQNAKARRRRNRLRVAQRARWRAPITRSLRQELIGRTGATLHKTIRKRGVTRGDRGRLHTWRERSRPASPDLQHGATTHSGLRQYVRRKCMWAGSWVDYDR